MLQMKTDLNKVNRLEKVADSWILTSGKTGNWVAPTANGVGRPSADSFAMPIFTESNRDGSAGFTGDTKITGAVTVLLGKMEAVTDQYVGTPAIGDKLYVDADGKLTTTGTNNPVAVCTKAPVSMSWFNNDINVIEYITV